MTSNRDWAVSPDVMEFVECVRSEFGATEAYTVIDFFIRADELDLVSDLVRVLREEHGDSVALFAAGWFGGSGDLPQVREKKHE